jgi:hypothetical protein
MTASDISTHSFQSSDVNTITLSCHSVTLGLGGLLGSGISCGTVTCDELSASTFYVDSILASNSLTAPFISVGTLQVDKITGLSGGIEMGGIGENTNLIDHFFDEGDTLHKGNMQVDGNLIVTGLLLTGAHNNLNNELAIDGGLSVSHGVYIEDSLTASFISVGTLQVEQITGLSGGIGEIGEGTNLIDNFFDEGDTLHQGNMQVDGNLIVTGLLLTGARNNLNELAIDGGLSVSHDVYIEDSSSSISVKSAILDLRNRLEALENST